MDSVSCIDCCGNPDLETVTPFLATERELVAIRRCRNCGADWFYHLREYQLLGGDPDSDLYDRRVWYVRLSPGEAAVLGSTPGIPDSRLFSERDGFLRDEEGLNRIRGIPDFLI